MAKIVVLSGSARKNGNTDLLVQAFVEGASARHEVSVFSVNEYKVAPCVACDTCFTREDHSCFQKDDMQQIYAALAEAEMVVVASPIYMCGISAQLKAVLDRLHTPLRNSFHIKKAALLLVAGNPAPDMFDPILAQYEMMLRFFEIEDAGRVLVGNVAKKGAIAERPEALAEARALGASL